MSVELDSIQHADLFDLCDGLPNQSIDMILADLPYGTTACSWDTVIPFEPLWAAFKRVIKPRGAIVLTASQPFTSALVMSNPRMFRYEIIVNKLLPTGYLDANRKPLKVHENILVFSDGQTTYNPQMTVGATPYSKMRSLQAVIYGKHERTAGMSDGERFPKSVIAFSFGDHTDLVHPTQKPVALFEYLIRTYTREGDTVLDPVVGSGTTAVAARACKRHYICGDSSAEYVAIARDRMRMPFEARQVPQNDDVSDLPLFAERTP